MAYTHLTDWKSEKEIAEFNRELLADDPARVSHGTQALAGLMGGLRPGG